MQTKGAQIGAGLRDRHRQLVRTDLSVLLPFEKEHAALLEVGGEQVEPVDETCELCLIRARHQLLAKAAQERALAVEDGLELLGELLFEREREMLPPDAALSAQEGMGALLRVLQECELTLTFVQETEILVPDDGAAVNVHARCADVV